MLNGGRTEELSDNLKLSAAFQGIGVDWQIGVTTTDTYRTEHPGRLLGGDDELRKPLTVER